MARETIVNGVDVGQMRSTIDHLRQNPHLAQYRFRATNQWIGGTHSCATVASFFGAGEEDSSREPLTFDMDEPPDLFGENRGANPTEMLLVALSGCLTTALVAQAINDGIDLDSVTSHVEGEIDLRGYLGLQNNLPIGFKNIRVNMHIDADIPDSEKERLIGMARRSSPVANTIANATPVTVQYEPHAIMTGA